MALPHPDVNAVLRFPAKLGTSHKKAPQNLFKTPFALSNFPPRPQARPCLPLRGRWREAPEGETGGQSRPPLHTSADSLCAIRVGGCTPRVLVPLRSTAWASAPTKSPAAYASYARADRVVRPYTRFPGGKIFPTGGPWPPPTFAASRQRRDLIIAHPPGGCFQRGRAAALPLWSFQGEGIFKGRGKSKSLSP